MSKTLICFLLLLFVVPTVIGCAAVQPETMTEITCVGRGVDLFEASADIHSALPRKVAIMPFSNTTGNDRAQKLVRDSFYRYFSAKRYQDVELFEIDDALRQYGGLETRQHLRKEVEELGKLLQADGVIYGTITGFDKVFLGLYSQVSVELEVRLIECKSGRELWRAKHRTTHREMDVPFEFLSIIPTLFRTTMNVSDRAMLLAAEDLCRTVVAALPEPESVRFPDGGTFFTRLDIASY